MAESEVAVSRAGVAQLREELAAAGAEWAVHECQQTTQPTPDPQEPLPDDDDLLQHLLSPTKPKPTKQATKPATRTRK